MHSLYVFDFLRTVSQQLKEHLESLPESALDQVALNELLRFQEHGDTFQGVYVIHYRGAPVYVGKANNVAERLSQHLGKLSGRKGIHLEDVGYKALLLDKSMSTAANEDILISMFREEHKDMWNGAGFGPKDPGQQRDTTKPGKFDQQFPIIEDYPVSLDVSPEGKVPLGQMLSAMKAQLPYVFRYDVPLEELTRMVPITHSPCPASGLLQQAVSILGAGWRGAVISYGMVLYKNNKHYPYGREINP